ncbi:MAG: DUF2267 domain-containing protein [Cyanobacteria bacterium J06621_8]
MNNNLLEKQVSTSSNGVAVQDKSFLAKVMAKSNISDVYNARSLTMIVFRTMRDLMTTEASQEVANELKSPVGLTDNKMSEEEIADLWKDANPLVRFLSQVRPTLKFDDDTFFLRIALEGGLPQTTDSVPEMISPETIVSAVFSATKEELSAAKIAEIASFLPGKVRKLWEQA